MDSEAYEGQTVGGNGTPGLVEEQTSPAVLQGTAWILSGAAVAVTLWVVLSPQLNGLAILSAAAMPWMALMLVASSAGFLRIVSTKRDPHPNVMIPFCLPGLALTLWVGAELHALEWKPMLLLTVILAAALAAGAIASDRWLRVSAKTMVGVVAVCGLWGYGAGLCADALLDASTGTVYAATVEGKRISGGRHTSYYLDLTPWGPQDHADEVSVPPRFYRVVSLGDTVCLPLRRGALGVAWYRVQRCR